jgi:competence CoiA-like predicted nuclease
MPKIEECLIGVDLAKAIRNVAGSLELKVPDGRLGFRCPECKRPVKPAVGEKVPPHFEHLKRNVKCSLSDRWRENRG